MAVIHYTLYSTLRWITKIVTCNYFYRHLDLLIVYKGVL